MKEREEQNEENFPVTVNQLKKWYQAKGLPPEEETHFYIGKDVKESNSFGIFRNVETNIVTLYENKNEGEERNIIYEGPDEEAAVNQMKSMIEEKYLKDFVTRISNKFKEIKWTREFITGIIIYTFIALVILAVAIDAVFFH
jgi:hypothetical protein